MNFDTSMVSVCLSVYHSQSVGKCRSECMGVAQAVAVDTSRVSVCLSVYHSATAPLQLSAAAPFYCSANETHLKISQQLGQQKCAKCISIIILILYFNCSKKTVEINIFIQL